jgi:prephenate dehydratase
MSTSAPPRVAFQGERGAFSEEAIHQCFGDGGAVPVPCREFAALGHAVIDGEAEYGMLPVENSIAGGVAPAYDILGSKRLVVVGEVVQPIRLCLLVVPGAARDGITRVLSHPVALAQCQKFLAGLAGADAIAVHDTAGAARLVAERRDPATAAVAPRAAAGIYGLDIMAENIQDRADNQTRFFVVARPGTPSPFAAAADAPRRTALLLDTAHRPGALVDALQPLADAGLNMLRIESRPAREPWHYTFFLELDTDAAAPRAVEAIAAMRARAHDVHVLGSFTRVQRPDS